MVDYAALFPNISLDFVIDFVDLIEEFIIFLAIFEFSCHTVRRKVV